MIQICLDCGKTFGRSREKGKCTFCNSTNIKPIGDENKATR